MSQQTETGQAAPSITRAPRAGARSLPAVVPGGTKTVRQLVDEARKSPESNQSKPAERKCRR